MDTALTSNQIPDDVTELKSLVVTLFSKIKDQNTEIESLRHKLRAQLLARFSSKSEKNKFQLDLFDEAILPEQPGLEEIKQADEEITIAGYTRKKSGRKALPSHLPREQIIHDLSEDEKVCQCGCQMHKIGEDKSEQLEWIPAQVKIIEHVRIKYGCRSCEECIKSAALPKLPNISNGVVEIDNNDIENLIRPFALGRRNWLFCNSVQGATAGAVIYSLIQTCKLNNIEPYAYFKYVLAHIRDWEQNKLKQLLPQHVDQLALIQAYTNSFLN